MPRQAALAKEVQWCGICGDSGVVVWLWEGGQAGGAAAYEPLQVICGPSGLRGMHGVDVRRR